jgi:hypothetical protein
MTCTLHGSWNLGRLVSPFQGSAPLSLNNTGGSRTRFRLLSGRPSGALGLGKSAAGDGQEIADAPEAHKSIAPGESASPGSLA